MFLRSLICAIGALALVSCGSTTASNLPTGTLAPPDPVSLAKLGANAQYRIGPADTLDISVFQVPDLTRTVQVDATGLISMPLIGAVPAAGRTTNELQAQIAAKLREKYLQSPDVSVAVREFASQRVTVDGAVAAPGIYPIMGRTTLMQIVAQAKGVDPKIANEKQVVIFRTINGQRQAARFDLAAIRKGEADDPEIYGNDVVVVDRSGSRSLLRDIAGYLPIISIFRPLIF